MKRTLGPLLLLLMLAAPLWARPPQKHLKAIAPPDSPYTWDRLVQVLEQIRRSPQPQQGNVYQLALQAADLNGLDLQGQTALDYAVDSVYAQSRAEYHPKAAAKLRALGVEHSKIFYEAIGMVSTPSRAGIRDTDE